MYSLLKTFFNFFCSTFLHEHGRELYTVQFMTIHPLSLSHSLPQLNNKLKTAQNNVPTQIHCHDFPMFGTCSSASHPSPNLQWPISCGPHQFEWNWSDDQKGLHQSIGECLAEPEMDSESNRRVLEGVQHIKYISYGTLKRDMVPCDRAGASYYNCHARPANPYNRGCEVITGCARGVQGIKTWYSYGQLNGWRKLGKCPKWLYHVCYYS